jgi:hypothetical protein
MKSSSRTRVSERAKALLLVMLPAGGPLARSAAEQTRRLDRQWPQRLSLPHPQSEFEDWIGHEPERAAAFAAAVIDEYKLVCGALAQLPPDVASDVEYYTPLPTRGVLRIIADIAKSGEGKPRVAGLRRQARDVLRRVANRFIGKDRDSYDFTLCHAVEVVKNCAFICGVERYRLHDGTLKIAEGSKFLAELPTLDVS